MGARGHDLERFVAKTLREAEYLVGSRRHEPGPGDLLAYVPHVAPNGGRKLVEVPPLLVEIKNTAGPFDHFSVADRRAMLLAEEDYGVEPLLAWMPPGDRKLFWIPADEWPETT